MVWCCEAQMNVLKYIRLCAFSLSSPEEYIDRSYYLMKFGKWFHKFSVVWMCLFHLNY